MAINQSSITAYAGRSSVRKSEEIVEEARLQGKQTAFLSHSHKDADLAMSVQAFLQANGWKVYIDWQDVSMPPKPNRATADKIKERLKNLPLSA